MKSNTILRAGMFILAVVIVKNYLDNKKLNDALPEAALGEARFVSAEDKLLSQLNGFKNISKGELDPKKQKENKKHLHMQVSKIEKATGKKIERSTLVSEGPILFVE